MAKFNLGNPEDRALVENTLRASTMLQTIHYLYLEGIKIHDNYIILFGIFYLILHGGMHLLNVIADMHLPPQYGMLCLLIKD